MCATRRPASTVCGNCDRREVVALRLDHQADDLALLDVQRALLDQVRVHAVSNQL